MELNSKFFRLTRHLDTPFIVYDLQKIKENYRNVARAFPKVAIHFVMKSNAHPTILQTLHRMEAGFEVASIFETEQLVKLRVAPNKIVCLHPIKSPQFLTYMHKHTIDVMAVDSYEEVDKIARFAPNAKLVIRVTVDNNGSGWQLTGKYGISVTELPQLFQYIVQKKLNPYGVTFHVGSQCYDESNWIKALYICNDVWKQAARKNIHLKLLSLGGGLAIQYTKPVPDIAHTGKIVMKEIKSNFDHAKDMLVSIEPGRAIVANAGTLVTTVFGKAKRGDKEWLYIDTGTYNGLVEAIETPDRQFYPLTTQHDNRAKKTYTIGGPTCVSLDTPFEDVALAEIHLDERLYIHNCGAYTTTCAAPFNGFPIPKEYIWEDLYAHNA